jgi:hypothetical protein
MIEVSLLIPIIIVSHALIMIWQLISLNVAINSYDHALLTLLVSNQFVEIKGSVFKKFEKDSLFQITCAGVFKTLAPSRSWLTNTKYRHCRTLLASPDALHCRVS